MLFENLISKEGKEIEGPKLITHDVFYDERGLFVENWNKFKFEKVYEKSINFSQLNQSRSCKGVLRGLHFQLEPESQGKLIKCFSGKIFDVVVDIRRTSETYSSWVGVELSQEKHQSLWIPPGFAHGFFTLSEYADIQYLVTNKWNRDLERCIIWNDQEIGIDWPFNSELPLISPKDADGMTLSKAKMSGNIFQ